MKRALFGVFVFLLVTFVSTFVYSQTGLGITPDIRAEANGYYQAGDWAKAAEAYEKIIKLEDSNVSAHYRLGLSLLNSNKAAEAVLHLERAMTASPNTIFALALAPAYGSTDNKTKGFEGLEKSPRWAGIAPYTLTS